MRRHGQAGFTIVEIMIIVAIIGILAVLVLPSIRGYSVRAKMSEAILALATCKGTVTELYQSLGDPPDPGNWGCEATNVSQYVAAVNTKDLGTIVVTLRGFNDGRLDTRDITLAPLDNTGSLPTGAGFTVRTWRCGSPIDGTDIPPQYIPIFLPSGCRG
jgi:type IV pilus assembly protein PilA